MSKTSLDPLFTSAWAGAIELPNRFVMAPLTRGRASADGTPTPRMIEYYRQRASAGMIITEATAISQEGHGWVGSPRIDQDKHVVAWRAITDAVHAAGGRIVLQLWHMGRVSHPDFNEGQTPVAPSAVAAQGDAHTPLGKKPYVVPRALETAEIERVVGDYAHATANAKSAGFDGVEIHAANGYLVDQFLRDCSNRRTDRYGGSVENRVRFLTEVTDAAIAEWSSHRVGVRLSPVNAYNDMRDSDPDSVFVHAAKELGARRIAYLHVLEGLKGSFLHAEHPHPIAPKMRAAFAGTFMVNGGYTAELAAEAIQSGQTDLVAFGVPFLANPDFVERSRRGLALNTPDFATFYSAGDPGYTDYPFATQ